MFRQSWFEVKEGEASVFGRAQMAKSRRALQLVIDQAVAK
jgi:hypothetical protein